MVSSIDCTTHWTLQKRPVGMRGFPFMIQGGWCLLLFGRLGGRHTSGLACVVLPKELALTGLWRRVGVKTHRGSWFSPGRFGVLMTIRFKGGALVSSSITHANENIKPHRHPIKRSIAYTLPYKIYLAGWLTHETLGAPRKSMHAHPEPVRSPWSYCTSIKIHGNGGWTLVYRRKVEDPRERKELIILCNRTTSVSCERVHLFYIYIL